MILVFAFSIMIVLCLLLMIFVCDFYNLTSISALLALCLIFAGVFCFTCGYMYFHPL